MIVKLSLLDRQDVLHYTDKVEVTVGNSKGYETIGTCRLFRDESGRHFGELELDQEVSGELYFYYRNRTNNAGIFIFSGLDLMEHELTHSRTTKLKEMIVG